MSLRTCAGCGADIQGRRRQARTCSDACRKTVERQRPRPSPAPPPSPPPRRPVEAVDDLEAALWRDAAAILGERARSADLDRAMGEARRQILAAVAAFLGEARRLTTARASLPRLTYPEALALLGLQEGASLEDARRARRVLALRWHPDRKPGPEAEAQMRRVNEAYDIIESHPRAKV